MVSVATDINHEFRFSSCAVSPWVQWSACVITLALLCISEMSVNSLLHQI